MSLSSSLLVLASLLPAQAPASVRIDQDFRGKQLPVDPLELIPKKAIEWVKPEEGGLRVTLTADQAARRTTAVSSKTPLVGDFEITASYEVLSLGKPRVGYGAGVNLTIQPDRNQQKLANVARYWMGDGKDGYVTRAKVTAKQVLIDNPPIPTEARSGRLRLRREGETVYYLVADGFDQPFKEIFKYNYGSDDVGLVRFVAGTGTDPIDLDVRLISLRIGAPDTRTVAVEDGAGAVAPSAAAPRRSLLPLLLLFAGLLVLFVVGLCWALRKRTLEESIDA